MQHCDVDVESLCGFRAGDSADGVEQRASAADADAGAPWTHGPADHRRERHPH